MARGHVEIGRGQARGRVSQRDPSSAELATPRDPPPPTAELRLREPGDRDAVAALAREAGAVIADVWARFELAADRS